MALRSSNMKITRQDIAKDLRPMGVVIKTILPYFSISSLHFFEMLTRKLFFVKKKKGLKCEQYHINSPNTKGKVRVAVYSSLTSQSNKRVGVLWIHGGGFAMSVPEQDIKYPRLFVHNYDAVVVSVDYTKSVKEPYPSALLDCYAALKWLKDNAEQLHINKNQIFVGGVSAGGGLTASLALYARDKQEVKIAFQMPIYPMLDDRMITKSSQDNDAPFWNSISNKNAWQLYLGDLFGTDQVDCYAAAARATDLKGLPPAFTYIGDIEPFYDETVDYFARLKAAGVKTYIKEFTGCFHGFDIVVPRSKEAKAALTFLDETFGYAVKNYFAEN